MKHIFKLLIAGILVASCNSIKNNEADLNNQLIIEKDSYLLIRHFNDGGKSEQGFDKLANNEDYLKWIGAQNFADSVFEELLSVDFEKQDLLIYYLGEKENKNYKLDIINTTFGKSTIDFEIKLKAEKEIAINDKKVTPYQLIAIPKNREVKFIVLQ